jgi:hypothetical protein
VSVMRYVISGTTVVLRQCSRAHMQSASSKTASSTAACKHYSAATTSCMPTHMKPPHTKCATNTYRCFKSRPCTRPQ